MLKQVLTALYIVQLSSPALSTSPHSTSPHLNPQMLNQVLTALYIMQLAMIGLLGLKQFPYTPILIIPLLATLAFHVIVMKVRGSWQLGGTRGRIWRWGFDRDQAGGRGASRVRVLRAGGWRLTRVGARCAEAGGHSCLSSPAPC